MSFLHFFSSNNRICCIYALLGAQIYFSFKLLHNQHTKEINITSYYISQNCVIEARNIVQYSEMI